MAPPPAATATADYYSHNCRSLRKQGGQLLEERGGVLAKRSASFNGRPAPALAPAPAPAEQRAMRRPKTQPDLLSAGRRSSASMKGEIQRSVGDPHPHPHPHPHQVPHRRAPAKLLVNVTVQRSLGPLQVMASAEWIVADLVAAAVRLYAKEGRRPLLPITDPSAFGLHYSQFSLQCLDPKEKLIGLGSRNFFLCPRLVSAPVISDATAASSSSSSCSREAAKPSKIGIPWLRFMDFLL